MKKWLALLLAAALCLGLTGCGDPPPPEKAEDGLDWDDSWILVGELIGVDTPEGMDYRENNEALAANGMYYAAWSVGEAVPYTNADGDEAELYDAVEIPVEVVEILVEAVENSAPCGRALRAENGLSRPFQQFP